MRFSLLGLLPVFCLLGPVQTTSGEIVTINFEDGTNEEEVGTSYLSLGIDFENASWAEVTAPPFDQDDGFGASGDFALVSTSTFTVIDENNALRGTFSIPVDFVSINAGDVGVHGARMNARSEEHTSELQSH